MGTWVTPLTPEGEIPVILAANVSPPGDGLAADRTIEGSPAEPASVEPAVAALLSLAAAAERTSSSTRFPIGRGRLVPIPSGVWASEVAELLSLPFRLRLVDTASVPFLFPWSGVLPAAVPISGMLSGACARARESGSLCTVVPARGPLTCGSGFPGAAFWMPARPDRCRLPLALLVAVGLCPGAIFCPLEATCPGPSCQLTGFTRPGSFLSRTTAGLLPKSLPRPGSFPPYGTSFLLPEFVPRPGSFPSRCTGLLLPEPLRWRPPLARLVTAVPPAVSPIAGRAVCASDRKSVV